MLKLLSRMIPTVVLPRPRAPRACMAGRIIASAKSATISTRRISSSNCRSWNRRTFAWVTSFRNSSDGKRTSRGLRQRIRWIRIGIAAASVPAASQTQMELRKVIAARRP